MNSCMCGFGNFCILPHPWLVTACINLSLALMSCNLLSICLFQMLSLQSKTSVYLNHCRLNQDRERTPHCIRTLDTECDLTAVLKNLKAYYSADVLSEPMRGVSSDLVEFPHVSSGKFSPYHDSQCLVGFFCI